MLSKKLFKTINKITIGFVIVFCMSVQNVWSASIFDVIKKRLEASSSKLSVVKVEATPLENMSLVTVKAADGGTQALYMTNDGGYIFTGDMIEVSGKGLINHADLARGNVLAKVAGSDMIVFAPEGEAKAEVFVFTDVDCGYCRKLHTEMPVINALGIKVNYLAFPRSGPGSRTAGKMQSVWCAENPLEAMTKSKQGQNLSNAGSCKNPVNKQYALGVQVGVRGTPAIFNASGEQIGGYLSGQDMARSLGL